MAESEIQPTAGVGGVKGETGGAGSPGQSGPDSRRRSDRRVESPEHPTKGHQLDTRASYP